jgi:hypothetical protein
MWGWRKCEVHGFSFEVKSEKKKNLQRSVG